MNINKGLLAFLILVFICGAAGVGWLFLSGKIGFVNNNESQAPVTETATPSAQTTATLVPSPSLAPISTNEKVSAIYYSSKVTGMAITPANAELTFSTATPAINILALLDQSVTDTSAVVEIQYLDTNEKLGPITATVKTEGAQKYITVKMTKPANNWAPGTYLVKIVLPSGGESQTSFEVQ